MAGGRKKIAVVVTHGMGEQIPMETLRGFVEAAWATNDGVHWRSPPDERPEDTWVKPDPDTGSLELRRITTRWTRTNDSADEKGPRVDFFEFYWADLAEGTTVGEVWDWVRTLLIRTPAQVPAGLMSAWIVLWIAAATVAILSLLAISPWPGGEWHAGFAIAAAIVGYAMQYVISPYVGDVARYVRADPRNVAMRQAIRTRGLELLKRLHDSGGYNRIIVVAHSLGTIVAYDLIALLWASRGKALTMRENEPAFAKLRAVETAAAALASATSADHADRKRDFREAQREFRLALRSGGADGSERQRQPDEEWLISDFVTLGSPLTHAEFLLARDEKDLADKKDRWLFPTNWPQLEKIESEQRAKIVDRPQPPPPEDKVWGPPAGLFSFFMASETWSMHHAAPFAAVRWTNIHDPHEMIYKGDIVSGPLEPVFGHGIRDIDLRALRGQSQCFSHTLYWDMSAADPTAPRPHLDMLRKAIDLLDRPDRQIWY